MLDAEDYMPPALVRCCECNASIRLSGAWGSRDEGYRCDDCEIRFGDEAADEIARMIELAQAPAPHVGGAA